MSRANEGYEITDVVKVGDFEIVIGEHPTAPDKFVCWYCRNENDYFWGAYSSNKADVLKKLCERVSYEAKKLDKAGAQRPVEHRPVRGDAR